MTATADWTFMVYMAGDNDLSAAGDRDLIEMRRQGSTDKVNIVVEFDNAGHLGTRRIHVAKDGRSEHIESLGETDSGSPKVLSDFIEWTASRYPADRYALVLWNHGCGWTPLEIDRVARSVESAGYNEREIAERSSSSLRRALFRTTLERVFELQSPVERAICSDDGSGHSLDTIELQRVMAKGVEAIGQPFDILGMDACLMSNLEVAYQLREYARVLVASEENEPADGWPYDRVLGRLVRNPSMSSTRFSGHIVDDYIDSYVSSGYLGDVTQSAINLSQITDLLTALDQMAVLLIDNMTQTYDAIWQAQRQSARFFRNTLWDIGHFCQELSNACELPVIRQAAGAVSETLAVGDDKALVAEAHHGAKVSQCRGLTAYLVPPITNISRYYAELDYARDFRWLDMLRAYHDFQR